MYLYERKGLGLSSNAQEENSCGRDSIDVAEEDDGRPGVGGGVVWGPKGSVASCRADVLVVRHYSVFYVHSVCSRFSSWGTASGVVGSNKVGRCCSVWTSSSSSSGRSISSTSCAASFRLGAGKQRRLLSGD